MASKQLESIMANIPPATVAANPERQVEKSSLSVIDNARFAGDKKRKIVKLVAAVPECIKEELQKRATLTGETEKTIILRALKEYGFNIDESMIVDQRTIRR